MNIPHAEGPHCLTSWACTVGMINIWSCIGAIPLDWSLFLAVAVDSRKRKRSVDGSEQATKKQRTDTSEEVRSVAYKNVKIDL